MHSLAIFIETRFITGTFGIVVCQETRIHSNSLGEKEFRSNWLRLDSRYNRFGRNVFNGLSLHTA